MGYKHALSCGVWRDYSEKCVSRTVATVDYSLVLNLMVSSLCGFSLLK